MSLCLKTLGAIHETGHALYEQGRNLEWDGLPVNKALSMGVHESQSLLWERMVGLSGPFMKYLLPKIRWVREWAFCWGLKVLALGSEGLAWYGGTEWTFHEAPST